MSDTSQGEGWWLASDGKWYPPTAAPAPAPPAPPYPQGAYNPAQALPTSNEAIWSLVLGILSLTCLGLIAGIPAVILGNVGKKKILASGGAIRGSGLATAGLVMGWVSIGLSAAFILLMIIGVIAGSGSSSGALGL
jgi:hypothetical protein